MKSKFTGCPAKGKTEGSVTIFLIMVLAFVFLFTAVLIDYARIAAFNVQEERLARASVRSVMSSYHVELREKYGLFAFGDSNGDMLLSKVLNENLHKSGRGIRSISYPLHWNPPPWNGAGRWEVMMFFVIKYWKR